MTQQVTIFNRALVRRRRDRAASGFGEYDFLLGEMAERLSDRLSDTTRKFPLALDLGCHQGQLARILQGRGNIQTLVQSDISLQMLKHAQGPRVVADEEWLPFADDTFDLVMSVGSLQWVNDLPGTLAQIHRTLKPDGLLLAVIPGGETLRELRECLTEASVQTESGASPRISPFVDVRDAGALLQRAQFALPVADTELVTVSYENPLSLMLDLRGMGETNALHEGHKSFTRRRTLMRAAAIYQEKYGDNLGRITATIELVTLTGWKPAATQQQPARRGSGKLSLAAVLGENVWK
jgi:NADH dehydrogenase [ubiquinone] 1 alpha subcomplex assembly factor 5